jgi:hypothetical protein
VAAAAKQARAKARNFYRHALDRAERADLKQAEKIEGLDDEIAVMRVRLKRAVEERPQDLQLVIACRRSRGGIWRTT